MELQEFIDIATKHQDPSSKQEANPTFAGVDHTSIEQIVESKGQDSVKPIHIREYETTAHPTAYQLIDTFPRAHIVLHRRIQS